jgi:hypothetical protein
MADIGVRGRGRRAWLLPALALAGVAGLTVLLLALLTNIFDIFERKHVQHRKAQWRLDIVAAENSMGFHTPQELARILGEVIDHARQGQLEAERTRRAR